ncbi:sensor histidine kinase [Amycolatopsis nigrescens]|uniref:sensor histidine kinase n=1 Tax=Amycolatopsis nigrescens TaxID=381445 RepID=UPI000367A232|nr:HAMP domain-containing sensor histidine kinase [Amycolatopsis nigrescens]
MPEPGTGTSAATKRRLSGLRPRLVIAFAVVALAGVVAAAGASYVSARTTILTGVQDQTMNSLKERINAFVPRLNLPPSQRDLDNFAGSLRESVVRYQNQRSVIGPDLSEVSQEMRQQVGSSDRMVFQRVSTADGPRFVVGTPVMTTGQNGVLEPSGVEVYSVTSLLDQDRAIADLARSAWLTGGLALPFAVALALLAARQVLRPVRQLHTVARDLASGRLDTRLRVRGSDELAGLVSAFNETAAALERTVGELRGLEADARRFVADVSHELRTPLAAMAAVTEVLDEDADQLPADTAMAARLVSEETRKLALLVQDLIELSRFDSARPELVLEEWDLATVVTDSVAARGWQDEVSTELPAGVSALVDRRRLDVVIANLVGNALRHGSPPVLVRLRVAGERIVLEVDDHGPGLDPASLPRVFDRFYKADTARARSEGSGLGLAIAWENARLHGGTLEAANRPDGGARFTLQVPLREVS